MPTAEPGSASRVLLLGLRESDGQPKYLAVNDAGELVVSVSATVASSVTVSSSALPTGAATSAKQDSQTTLLAGGLPAALGAGGGIKIDGSGTAVPISAAALPLPSGAATSAKQDSQTTLLAGGLPAALATGGGLKIDLTTITGIAPNLGTGNTGTGTLRVVLATDQPALTNALLTTPGGNVASGGSDSGSPIKIGAVYTSAKSAVTDGQRINLQSGSRGALCVQIMSADSTTQIGATAAGDALGATNTGLQVVSWGLMYNGSSMDRIRSNLSVQLLASSSRTTTQTGADTTNFNGLGLRVIVDVTSAGTGSITMSVQGKSATGIYYTILAGAAIVTAVTNVYTIFPGSTVTANVSANQMLPRTFRIVITANNANAMTYSVDYEIGNF